MLDANPLMASAPEYALAAAAHHDNRAGRLIGELSGESAEKLLPWPDTLDAKNHQVAFVGPLRDRGH